MNGKNPSLFSWKQIPHWREMGLTEDEIHKLRTEIPYHLQHKGRQRDLIDEKPQIIEWIHKGINASELARLLSIPKYRAVELLEEWG